VLTELTNKFHIHRRGEKRAKWVRAAVLFMIERGKRVKQSTMWVVRNGTLGVVISST
jgi:hypothetical protein